MIKKIVLKDFKEAKNMAKKIEIVDESGHQELVFASGKEGLELVKPYQKSEDYWVYMDGKLVNKDKISAKDIEEANSIKVGLSQQGGC